MLKKKYRIEVSNFFRILYFANLTKISQHTVGFNDIDFLIKPDHNLIYHNEEKYIPEKIRI